jgi:ubiquinone/menaquinone biosynthesis C-methylase UbiE
VKKADYREISSTYDLSRPISEKNLALWLELISGKIGPRRGLKLLDLGCGTGRFSIPIAKRLGCHVTGADSSGEMLRRAMVKEGSGAVEWHIQDAESLSYPDIAFDVVFMSHLLHHVDDPIKVVKESHRVLRPGGVILNRYGSMGNIHSDPEHRFFPETIEIDKGRTPTVGQVEG